MDASIATALRAPFPAEQIGQLPRVTCGDCSDRSTRCSKHERSKCSDCGAYVSTAHIHLDYVGHADVTSRLLEVDPDWTWEPLATDDHGLPVFDTDNNDRPVGLWIRLTVGGVSRLGYGSCPSSQNDAVKVLIGDALRNAAMRFGVAVDLWAKGDRKDPAAENAVASGGQAQRRRAKQQAEPDPEQAQVIAMKREVVDFRKTHGLGADPKLIAEHFTEVTGMEAAALQTRAGLEAYLAHLREDAAKRNGHATADAS